jgi:hypothetical protein
MTPRDKFVILNIFGRSFSVDFPTREYWSTECVDLDVPDGLVFFIARTELVPAYSLTF